MTNSDRPPPTGPANELLRRSGLREDALPEETMGDYNERKRREAIEVPMPREPREPSVVRPA